jgi:hypothetical protein
MMSVGNNAWLGTPPHVHDGVVLVGAAQAAPQRVELLVQGLSAGVDTRCGARGGGPRFRCRRLRRRHGRRQLIDLTRRKM